jgi:outer membrane protein TolC
MALLRLNLVARIALLSVFCATAFVKVSPSKAGVLLPGNQPEHDLDQNIYVSGQSDGDLEKQYLYLKGNEVKSSEQESADTTTSLPEFIEIYTTALRSEDWEELQGQSQETGKLYPNLLQVSDFHVYANQEQNSTDPPPADANVPLPGSAEKSPAITTSIDPPQLAAASDAQQQAQPVGASKAKLLTAQGSGGAQASADDVSEGPQAASVENVSSAVPETSSPQASGTEKTAADSDPKAIATGSADDAPVADMPDEKRPDEDLAADDLPEMPLLEVIRRAVLESPERRAARAQVKQAVAAVDEARSGYWPQASIKIEGGREYNNPYAVKQGATPFPGQSYGNNSSVNVRQMLFDGFVTSASVEQRLQLARSARLGRDRVHEEIVATTVEVYMQLRQHQQALMVAEDNLHNLKAIAAIVDLRAEAGDTSKSEQDYMRARLAAAQQAVISTRSFLKDSMSTLTYLIGDVGPFIAVMPDEKAEDLLGNPDAVTHEALARNIDVRLNASELQAARSELRAARGRYYPNLNFVMDGNHSEDLGGEVGVKRALSGKLELNIRLYDGGLRAATVQRQLGKISELKARADRVQRELVQNVRQAVNKLQSAAAELRSTEEEIKANTDLASVYFEQFQFGDGDVDITRLVESQERIYAAQVKKTRLESDQIIAHVQLRRLNGTLLQEFCEGCRK